jgi:hypothetical protein
MDRIKMSEVDVKNQINLMQVYKNVEIKQTNINNNFQNESKSYS